MCKIIFTITRKRKFIIVNWSNKREASKLFYNLKIWECLKRSLLYFLWSSEYQMFLVVISSAEIISNAISEINAHAWSILAWKWSTDFVCTKNTCMCVRKYFSDKAIETVFSVNEFYVLYFTTSKREATYMYLRGTKDCMRLHLQLINILHFKLNVKHQAFRDDVDGNWLHWRF